MRSIKHVSFIAPAAKRLGAVAVSAALVASVMSMSAAVSEEVAPATAPDSALVEPVDSDDDGTLDAPDKASAIAGARAEDESVENLAARTATSTTAAQPDGSFMLTQFGTTHWVKRDGEWLDVDYTLEQRPDGSYEPKVSSADVVIGGGGDNSAAKVTFDDGKALEITWPQQLPEPTVEGATATYALSAAADLVVSANDAGASAHVVLKSQPAEDDPTFTFGLTTTQSQLVETSTGGLVIEDDRDKVVGGVASLVAWDSKTDASGDIAEIVPLQADLTEVDSSADVTDHELELTPPAGYLSDPETVYPVVIDPNVRDLNKSGDVWVREGDTANTAAQDRLIVGRVVGSSNSNPARSYIQFIMPGLASSTLVSANIDLWQYTSASCNPRTLVARPISSVWDAPTTVYTNRPSIRSTQNTYMTANRGIGCSPASGWTSVDVSAMTKEWLKANEGTETYGNAGTRLDVGSDNEDDLTYERRFCSFASGTSGAVQTTANCDTTARQPKMEIIYNENPMEPAAPTVTFGGNPVTVTAKVDDPNFESSLRAKIVVTKTGTTDAVFTGNTNSISIPGDQTTPQPVTRRLPYLPDGEYKVTAQAFDDLGRSSAVSSSTAFTVDTELGSQGWFSTTQHGLSDRMGLQVNSRTGNLAIQASDLKVNGLGLDLDLTRFYNSEQPQLETSGLTGTFHRGTSMGKGWTLSAGPDVFLEKRGETYVYHSPGGTVFGPFTLDGTSTTKYKRLKDGSGADLTRITGNSNRDFTVTFRKSQIKYDFKTVGTSGDAYLSKIRDRSDNEITFGYPSGATTPNGQAKLETIADASGRGYTVTYSGNYITKIAETSTGGREWKYEYDTAGYPTKYIDPELKETTYHYVSSAASGAKLLDVITGPRTSATIEYNNDAGIDTADTAREKLNLDRVKKVTYRESDDVTHTYQWSYDRSTAPGRCPNSADKYSTVVVDAEGGDTTYCFTDGGGTVGAKLRVVDDAGNVKTMDYTADRGVSGVTNPSNNATNGATVSAYGAGDLSDQLNKVTEPKTATDEGATTQFTYDNASARPGGQYQPTSSSDPNGDCTAFEYNDDGYTTSAYTGLASDNGSCTKGDKVGFHRSYNDDGTVRSSWDANADTVDQPDDEEVDPASKTVYSYYPTGDAAKRTGQVKTIRRPGGSCDTGRKLCTTYDYDRFGRVTSIADGRNKITTFTYDKLDRTTEVVFNGDSACNVGNTNCVTYAYDDEGNLTSRTDKSGTSTFTYDGMNRQIKQVLPGVVIDLKYDGNGNLKQHDQQLTGEAKQVVKYGYDGANRLTSVKYGANEDTIEVTPDADGRVKKIAFPGSVQANYDFTKAGRPKTANVKSNSGGTTLRSYEYDYTKTLTLNAPGLPPVDFTMESKQLQERIAGGTDVDDATSNYDYDEGRIESAEVGGLPDFVYTHDEVGNVTSEASAGDTTFFGYDRAGQLCWRGDTDGDKLNTTCQDGPSGSTDFTHDAAGNNTNLSSNPTVYNDDSQVATIDGVEMGYQDRGNDLRTTSGSSTWVNSPNGITARKTGANTTYYVRDPNGQILASYGFGGTRFYFSEFNGSVAAIYNTNGEEVAAYTYSPYGKTTVDGPAGADNPFRYIGGLQDKDANGDDSSYKLGARYYDAQGHFTQPDPIVPGGGSYTYADGDPINMSDPSGLYPGDPDPYDLCGVSGTGYYAPNCGGYITGGGGDSSVGDQLLCAATGVANIVPILFSSAALVTASWTTRLVGLVSPALSVGTGTFSPLGPTTSVCS